MKRRYRKIKDGCEIQKTITKGKITFKCKNLNRKPTAEEIVRSLK